MQCIKGHGVQIYIMQLEISVAPSVKTENVAPDCQLFWAENIKFYM